MEYAVVVLASRTGSQPPYGTTEHATLELEWAKAAGRWWPTGRVAAVASALSFGRGVYVYAYATVVTSRF